MRKYVIALYIRLSVEDIKTESLSIPNQRLILREKAMSLPEWDNGEVLEFVDNGHTGTNFERPAVQELLTITQYSTSCHCSTIGANTLMRIAISTKAAEPLEMTLR